MSTLAEVMAAIDAVSRSTGDPNAWTTGLDPSITDLTALPLRPASWDTILESLRRRYPQALAPPATADSPARTPPADAAPQQGEGPEAIRKAETDLVKQHSEVALLDLHVITAVLNARATTEQGERSLRELQRDIETAVQTRTDLDTPAGARDFQRFLIGKLRQIGAVVEAAGLDATSKATLAGAWAALYRAATTSAAGGPAGTDAPEPAVGGRSAPEVTAKPAPPATNPDLGLLPAPEDLLPAYGEPLIEPPPAAPMSVAPAPPATAPAGAALPAPTPPSAAALPLPALPALGPLSAEPSPSTLGLPSQLSDLFAEPEPPPERIPEEPDDDAAAEQTETETEEGKDTAADTRRSTVQLPDGEEITAPNPRIAAALTATLSGTPIDEAFRREAMVLPEPGSPVVRPLDPGRLGTGDIGVFTDRLAVALDGRRAWHDGQVQPIANVAGPSFLGWQHLPDVPTPQRPDVPAPQSAQTPAPTRPAA